jgi:SAM-dependent methyltransferase
MSGEWVDWHRNYDEDPTMRARLAEVQRCLREALDRAPPGPLRVVSACAGDGRDVLGVLERHPRTPDVAARLVEISPELVARGRERARALDLPNVEFLEADAGNTRAYGGAVPANVVLLCGIFGNITDEDLRNTTRHASELCSPEATLIWTRGRFEPDLTPTIRAWFEEAGFRELSFVTIPDSTKAVGCAQLTRAPARFRTNEQLFTFLPEKERPSQRSKSR